MWQSDLARALDHRIGPAPPALVEYLTFDNISNGYPQRPRAAALDDSFVADLKAAVAELPPQVWSLFSPLTSSPNGGDEPTRDSIFSLERLEGYAAELLDLVRKPEVSRAGER